jgi:hypothetical protein
MRRPQAFQAEASRLRDQLGDPAHWESITSLVRSELSLIPTAEKRKLELFEFYYMKLEEQCVNVAFLFQEPVRVAILYLEKNYRRKRGVE